MKDIPFKANRRGRANNTFRRLMAAIQAASSQASYAAKSFYLQPFTGADTTPVVNLSGMNAWDSTGTPTANTNKNNLKVTSNQAKFSAGDFTQPDPGSCIIGYQAATTNHMVKATIGTSDTWQLVCAASSTTNAIYIKSGFSGINIVTLAITKVIGVSVTTLQTLTSVHMIAALGRTMLVGDVIEAHVYGQSIDIIVNGSRLTADGGLSLDTGGAYTKGTLCGFGTRTTSGVIWDDFYVADIVGQLKVVGLTAFAPGSSISGQGTFAIAGTYVGTVLDLDYRLVNGATLAPIGGWTRMGSRTISGGNWSSTITAPLNSLDGAANYRVQIRPANETDGYDCSTKIAVGLTYASYGQSNSLGRDKPAGTLPQVDGNAYFWDKPNGNKWYRNTIVGDPATAELGHVLSNWTRRPVGFICGGTSGTPIHLLTSTASPNTDWLAHVALMTSANCLNLIHGWIWTHGEADADQAFAWDPVAYKSDFNQIMTDLRSISVSSTIPVGITIIGTYEGVPTSPGIAPDSWPAGRRCLWEISQSVSGAYISDNLIDLAHTDAFHYTTASMIESDRRAAHSMSKALGYADFNGAGPYVTSASRSGAVITLTLNLNDAVSIAGTGLTNYDVSTDNFATTKTISSVAVSGSNIVITLAADPGVPVTIRSFYGYKFTSPVFAIATYSDATTCPVLPVFVPITTPT